MHSWWSKENNEEINSNIKTETEQTSKKVNFIINILSILPISPDFGLNHDIFLILQKMMEAFNDDFSDVHFPMCAEFR